MRLLTLNSCCLPMRCMSAESASLAYEPLLGTGESDHCLPLEWSSIVSMLGDGRVVY